MEVQRGAIRSIIETANNIGADIVHLGDIFDKPRADTLIVNMLIYQLYQLETTSQFYFIAGNHDVPYRSYKSIDEVSIGTIKRIERSYDPFLVEGEKEHIKFRYIPAGKSPIVKEAYNVGIEDYLLHSQVCPESTSWILAHHLTFQDRSPIIAEGLCVEDWIRAFPNARLFTIGDNHSGFIKQTKEALFIVPGSMTRQTIDQADYQPRSYVVEWKSPYDVEVIDEIKTDTNPKMTESRYISTEGIKDERLNAFIQILKKQSDISLDFIENVRKFLSMNEIDMEVKREIRELFAELDVKI